MSDWNFDWKSPPELIRMERIELGKTNEEDMVKAWWLYTRAKRYDVGKAENIIWPHALLLACATCFGILFGLKLFLLFLVISLIYITIQWKRHQIAMLASQDYMLWMLIIIRNTKHSH